MKLSFMPLKGLLVVVAAAAFAGSALGQDLPKADNSIQRLYSFPVINGRSPAAPKMAPNGNQIVYGWNQTGERKLDLWIMDYPSGKAKRIVEAAKIEDLPRQDDVRTDQEKSEAKLYDGGIGGAMWSPDSKQILFQYKGRTFLVDPSGDNLHPIFDGHVTVNGPKFSPDNRYISYSDGQNVYRFDRTTHFVKQLTFVSKANTSVDGHDWSPDGKSILVNWSDSSKTGHHVMMDFSKDRATVVNIQREWNGDLDVDNQIGIISADGGIIRFVAGLPRYMWMLATEWSPDSSSIAVDWIQDDFKAFTITKIDPKKATKVDIYTEKAPKNYIPDWRPLIWSRNGKQILFGTDIVDGKFTWRSIMQMDADGKNPKKFFAEHFDVAALARPKDSDRIFLSTLAHSPLRSEITIVEPNGKRTEHIVKPDGMAVPGEFDALGLPLYSDDGTKVATMASDRTINPELYSVEPQIHRLTKSQLPQFDQIKWADFKEVTFAAPDGATIHGLLITKPGLDLTVKHPAFISNIYANSAKTGWGGYFENYAAMNLDMVVLCVDFRASWGYGGEFNSGYYRQMGLIDADEAVAAKNYLAGLSYVRGDRVGIWGWSYGGYLTCMSLLTKPGTFYAGVAVAPVTDWKSYNEWYTRRRLGLAKDDPKIFEKTSPITYADGLKDHLLLVHGLLDDNVLFQDTARLIQRLIDHGKYFDLMVYPRDDHGIGKETSRPHVFGRIMTYLYDQLITP
ncbi:MAG: prolyl oligopeptidase family serine peptidase [Fimbriimonas sp.]|nr:prolyl oligopeptidase family serine peptidase [Fimbriimonas sp.]